MNRDVEVFPLNVMKCIDMFLWRISALFAGKIETDNSPLAKIDRGTFLPMMRWVLATGQEQGSLVAALHNLAEVYRKRATYQADKLSVFLPTVLMIAIGASATLFYGLALFIPLTNLLRELTLP